MSKWRKETRCYEEKLYKFCIYAAQCNHYKVFFCVLMFLWWAFFTSFFLFLLLSLYPLMCFTRCTNATKEGNYSDFFLRQSEQLLAVKPCLKNINFMRLFNSQATVIIPHSLRRSNKQFWFKLIGCEFVNTWLIYVFSWK